MNLIPRKARIYISPAMLFVAVLFVPAAFAQAPVRVSIPGTTFTGSTTNYYGRNLQVASADVPGGRRFIAQPGTQLTLRGALKMPPGSTDGELARLIVHFSTKGGPELRSVDLQNGTRMEHHYSTDLSGDYLKTERANAWTFQNTRVSPQWFISLEVSMPTGIDSVIPPGDFVLTTVEADFALGPIPRSLTTGGRGSVTGASVTKPPVDTAPLLARGTVLASNDPLSAAIRDAQPDEPSRRGYSIGLAAAEGQTLAGPGKDAMHDALPVPEQAGFALGVRFSVDRNRNARLAGIGAEIAGNDVAIAKARQAGPVGLYTLGFDIATGIFGDPKWGAQGNTLPGPGSLGIRDALDAHGKQGFNDSMALNCSSPGCKDAAKK